ncbi:MAG: hypothetical protein AAGJ37_00415 [Pseudomonadota bacterium]
MALTQTRVKKRNEKHHWWPKTLSKHWSNSDGKVNGLRPTGEQITQKPTNFGFIKGAHNLLFEKKSDWEFSFERFFDEADNKMNGFVADLKEFRIFNEFGRVYSYATQDELDKNLEVMSKCMLSLIIRSPEYRNNLGNMITGIRGSISSKKELEILISHNQGLIYKRVYSSHIFGRGNFIIMFSDENEFIFGDGFYNNFPVCPTQFLNFETVIPITPNIAVAWVFSNRFRTKPRAKAISIEPDDVLLINEATQIYSKDFLFFRYQKPFLFEFFTKNQHLEISPTTNYLHKLLLNELDSKI